MVFNDCNRGLVAGADERTNPQALGIRQHFGRVLLRRRFDYAKEPLLDFGFRVFAEHESDRPLEHGHSDKRNAATDGLSRLRYQRAFAESGCAVKTVPYSLHEKRVPDDEASRRILLRDEGRIVESGR